MDRIYNIYTELIGHSKEITSINYKNNILVSGSKDCSVIVWKRNGNEIIKYRILNGHTDVVQSVVISDCGLYVISGSWDTTVRIWNIEDNKCEHILSGHTKEILCCSTQYNSIVSSSKDGTIKVWDLQTGQCKYTTVANKKENEWIDTCQLSPVNEFIVYSTSNGRIGQIGSSCGYTPTADQNLKYTKIIDDGGTWIKLLNSHNHWILSPDNSLLSVGGNNGEPYVYDHQESRLTYVLSHPSPSPINYLMYSPTRYQLATATDNGIKIYNLESKEIIQEIKLPLKSLTGEIIQLEQLEQQQNDIDQIVFKFKEFLNPYNDVGCLWNRSQSISEVGTNENDIDIIPKCLSITWDDSHCLCAAYDDNIIRVYS